MTESEKIKLEKLEKDTDKQYHLYWVPMRWAQNAVRQEGTNIAKMTGFFDAIAYLEWGYKSNYK